MRLVVKIGLIFDRFNNILAGIMTTLMVVMSIIICLNAITRVFSFHFVGLLELARFSLVWITFCAAAWLLRRNGHIRLDTVTARLNPKASVILDIATWSFNLVLFMLFTWYGAKITLEHFQNNFIIGDSLLYLPKYPIEAIIPLGCFMLVIEILRKIFGRWTDWKTLIKE